jgi:HSP20 family protein
MFKLVPVRPVRKLSSNARSEDIFDQFFDSFFNDDVFTPFNKIDKRVSGFMVDVLDDGDKYVIEADLPGFSKENVKVEYNDQHLSILAKREDVNEDKKDNYIRRERYTGEFRRSFFVDNIDPDQILASFDQGILTVTLKKKPLSNNSREIIID